MSEPVTKKATMEEVQLSQPTPPTQNTSDSVSQNFEPKKGGTFGVYTLEAPLGDGGFGEVWSGRGPKGEVVAIKKQTVEKGVKEAAIMRQLKNKYIVEFIDLLEFANFSLIIMEKCDGDLRRYLNGKVRERITNPEIRGMMQQLSSGIQYLRGEGIVHFDITPVNVMLKTSKLDAPVKIKVSDFGEAFRLTDEALTKDLEPVFAANWGYMPPEVLRYEKPIAGYITDVWSLGAILYEFSFRDRFCRKGERHLAVNDLFVRFEIRNGTTTHPIEKERHHDRLAPLQKELLVGCLAYKYEDRLTIEDVIPKLLEEWPGTVVDLDPEDFDIPSASLTIPAVSEVEIEDNQVLAHPPIRSSDQANEPTRTSQSTQSTQSTSNTFWSNCCVCS